VVCAFSREHQRALDDAHLQVRPCFEGKAFIGARLAAHLRPYICIPGKVLRGACRKVAPASTGDALMQVRHMFHVCE
jgi:hypothetical protein